MDGDNGTNPSILSPKLKPRQRRALEVLLKTGNVTMAAEAAHVARWTVHRWLHEATFAASLAEAESEALAELSRRLIGLGDKAGDTLEAAMNDELAPRSTRLRAADVTLSHLLRLRELVTLEERVAALEEAILDKEGGSG
jgi:hypothetical protein